MSSVRRPQWQTVPNSRTGSAKASVSEAVVRTWQSPHTCYQRKTEGIVGCLRRHLTAQCLAHQTGEFELHSPPNKKPVQLTQHRRNVVTTSGSGDEACCAYYVFIVHGWISVLLLNGLFVQLDFSFVMCHVEIFEQIKMDRRVRVKNATSWPVFPSA